LGEVLSKAKRKGRMALSRNNQAYEGIVKDLEHLLTALEIRQRKGRGRGKRISWEALKAKHGLQGRVPPAS
jgi:hypothetical protein